MYSQTFFVIARSERPDETPGPRFLRWNAAGRIGWVDDPLKARQWETAVEAADFQAGHRVEGAAYRVDLTVAMAAE